ncbi:hypothetical protein N9N28_03655 [Rubripirellula amarantea]|nr:hypothetical protein [Rubripirellula amarantea]
MRIFNRRQTRLQRELLAELSDPSDGFPRQHRCRDILREICEMSDAWFVDTLRLKSEVAERSKKKERYGW